jgi:tetratricopeptide (TPR) repeat protein
VPSVDNLDKFRSLFRTIGNEARDVASKGLPFTDLELPGSGGAFFPPDEMPQDGGNIAEPLETLDAVPAFDLGDLFEDTSPLDEDVIPRLDNTPEEGINPVELPEFDENATPTGDSLPPDEDAIPRLDNVPEEDLNLDELPEFNENATPTGDSLPPDDKQPPLGGDTDGTASDIETTDLEQAGISMPDALDTGVGIEDFMVPDLDDSPNKTTAILSGLPKSSEDVEEIVLSEEDYEHLKNALASYPLNLRIACEELIAEQAVLPDLMSKLIKLLIKEAPAQEVADLAGKIQGRIINIPKGFEKRSGADIEAEKNSFKYIFIHKILPIAGFTLFGILVALSIVYLVHRFIYIPLHAESMYKQGYAIIDEGKFQEANKKFAEAFKLHRVKKWFSKYAEAFIGKRQYLFAEEKYQELLTYYPKEKRAALNYAELETNQLQNYEKADGILRKYILNYSINDKDALLALGDNALAWGEIDPSKYETAREAYARYMEAHGQSDPVLERMLKYFIRTGNLKEVLPLQRYFSAPETGRKRTISAETFTEMSGYLLDKQFEDTEGVPDEYVSQITGVRDLLLKAVEKGPAIPETHYNLSRYYHYFDNLREERSALERAIPLFDAEGESTAKRTKIRLDAERRYAETLIANKEFFAAEEHLQKGIELYEDALSRKFISPDPQSARLYANMGDLNYFTKEGDMDMALQYYTRAEQNGWSPPEMQYRMGSAHYHLQQWAQAQRRFIAVADMVPYNRRILNSVGNASYIQGDYFIAKAYYSRLLDMLNADKSRFPVLSPQTRDDHFTLAERLMVAENNMGVTLETLTTRTGNPEYKKQALDYYINSSRAWDSLTRDPQTLVRAGITDLTSPGVNLANLNSQNAFNPEAGYEPQIYVEIDKDVLEPSPWETLVPQDIRLSEPLR